MMNNSDVNKIVDHLIITLCYNALIGTKHRLQCILTIQL